MTCTEEYREHIEYTFHPRGDRGVEAIGYRLHGARGESGGSLDRGHRVREKLVRGTLNDG